MLTKSKYGPQRKHPHVGAASALQSKYDIAEFGASWLRDRRNNPADATRGDFENIDLAVAMKPVGSSVDFFRVFLQNSTYSPIGRRLVFARSTRFGVQNAVRRTVSTEIPLPERFFAGGGTSCAGLRSIKPGRAIRVPDFRSRTSLGSLQSGFAFPMHLPLIGDRLGGPSSTMPGTCFRVSRRFVSHRAACSHDWSTIDAFNHPTTVCLTNCTNELAYFSHTVGLEFRYGTPIGPVALDLGYQLNPARFVVQSGTCPATPPRRARRRFPGCRPSSSSSTWDDILMRRSTSIFAWILLFAAASPAIAAGWRRGKRRAWSIALWRALKATSSC